MSAIKIVECKGYSKVEAMDSAKLNFDCTTQNKTNATKAWEKAGKPTLGTSGFKAFATEFLKKNTKLAPNLGAYIVIDNAVADTRERPYKVISVTTDGQRKFKRVYQIVEAELATKNVKSTQINEETGEEKQVENLVVTGVKSIGKVIGSADKKGDAFDLAKEATALNKASYMVTISKVVTEGVPVAGYCVYTPSTSAKVGTFIAFGVERD